MYYRILYSIAIVVVVVSSSVVIHVAGVVYKTVFSP